MVFAFDCVQSMTDFGRGVFVVIQVADECGDGALEIDVILPERVVSIDEERLARLENCGMSLSYKNEAETILRRREACNRICKCVCHWR